MFEQNRYMGPEFRSGLEPSLLHKHVVSHCLLPVTHSLIHIVHPHPAPSNLINSIFGKASNTMEKLKLIMSKLSPMSRPENCSFEEGKV